MKTIIIEKIKNVIADLKKEAEHNYLPFDMYGIRFETRKNLEKGYRLENSKGNPNRWDAREFPEFDSEEYKSLPELNGTCAYYVFCGMTETENIALNSMLNNVVGDTDEFACYLIGCNGQCEDGEDDHEIIMPNAVVVTKI